MEARACKRPRRLRETKLSFASAEKDLSIDSVLRQHRGQRFIVFTGAGVSASAGLSTFTDTLYQKTARKFGWKKSDGQKAFSFRFMQTSETESFQLFAELYDKSRKATPTLSHEIINELADAGILIRHYTLNIDGLAGTNKGSTIELHGSLRHLVCRKCGNVTKTSSALDRRKTKPIGPLPTCECDKCDGNLRFRVLLYGDEEGGLINSSASWEDGLRSDLSKCGWIVWVGVSFFQSASCEHFRTVLSAIDNACPFVRPAVYIVNPDAPRALENVETVVGDVEGVFPIRAKSDDFFRGMRPVRSATFHALD